MFNNGYFKSLLLKGWAPKLAVGGNPNKNQWTRVDVDAPSDHKDLMLNSDICLVYDNNKVLAECKKTNKGPKGSKACKKFNKSGVPIDATAGTCCAWTGPNCLYAKKGLIRG